MSHRGTGPLSKPEISTTYASILSDLRNLSLTYYYSGDMNQAAQLARQAADIARNPSVAPVDQIKALLHLADVLVWQAAFQTSDFDAAQKVLEQAHTAACEQNALVMVGRTVDLLGLLGYFRALSGLASYESALVPAHEAHDILVEAGSPQALAEALFHLGLIYQNTDQTEQASGAFEHALSIAQAHDLKVEQSFYTRHLAMLAEKRGDLTSAEIYYRESLSLRQETGYQVFTTLSHTSLGLALAELGKSDEARSHIEQAVSLARTLNLPRILMVTHNGAGQFFESVGYMAAARAAYEEALQFARRINHQQAVEEIEDKMKALG